jgi:seryl-tRNA synthetase
MNIEQLVKRQDALVAEMNKGLKARGFDAAIVSRPIEIQERRAASIKGRIEALEQSKREQAKAIDSEISNLKAELETLSHTLKRDRELLAPALKAGKAGIATPKATSPKTGKA